MSKDLSKEEVHLVCAAYPAVCLYGAFLTLAAAQRRVAQLNPGSKHRMAVLHVPVDIEGVWYASPEGALMWHPTARRAHLVVLSWPDPLDKRMVVCGLFSSREDAERRLRKVNDAYGPWPRDAFMPESERPNVNIFEVELGVDMHLDIRAHAMGVDAFWETSNG